MLRRKKSFLRSWDSYLYLTQNCVGYKFSKKEKCNYDKIIFHHWIFEFSLKCVSFFKRELYCKRDRGNKRLYSLTNEKPHFIISVSLEEVVCQKTL